VTLLGFEPGNPLSHTVPRHPIESLVVRVSDGSEGVRANAVSHLVPPRAVLNHAFGEQGGNKVRKVRATAPPSPHERVDSKAPAHGQDDQRADDPFLGSTLMHRCTPGIERSKWSANQSEPRQNPRHNDWSKFGTGEGHHQHANHRCTDADDENRSLSEASCPVSITLM